MAGRRSRPASDADGADISLGDDDDILESLLQLKHQHAQLMQEKLLIEQQYQEVEHSQDSLDRVVDGLRRQVQKLTRDVAAEKDASAWLAKQLEDAESREATATRARSVQTQQRASGSHDPGGDDDDDVDMSPPSSPAPPFLRGVPTDLESTGMFQLLESCQAELKLQRRKQRAYQRAIRRLQDDLDEARVCSQTPGAGLHGNSGLLDPLPELDTLADWDCRGNMQLTRVVLRNVSSGEAMAVLDAQKQLAFQADLQARLHAAAEKTLASDARLVQLQDLCDELQARLESAGAELLQARRDARGGAGEVSFADEMAAAAAAAPRGMTVDEQSRVLHERVQMMLEIDQLKDQLVSTKLRASKIQWKEQSLRMYASQRDRTVLELLGRPLNKQQCAKIRTMLVSTALPADDSADDAVDEDR